MKAKTKNLLRDTTKYLRGQSPFLNEKTPLAGNPEEAKEGSQPPKNCRMRSET